MTTLRSVGGRYWSWLGWWLPAAAVTGLVVGVAGPDLAVTFGYRSLGLVGGAGLPFARTLAIGAGTAAVAGLLVAAVHVPGRSRGALSAVGYDALRVVTRACAVLAAASAAVAVLTVAENVGLRPGALLGHPPTLLTAVAAVGPAAGWAVTAAVAALVGGLGAVVLTWRGSVGMLVVLLAGLAAPPMTAVANSERSHDWYGDAVTLHTIAATLWVGSTTGLLFAARRGALTAAARRRHAALATLCAAVLVLSGVVPTALDVGTSRLLTSGYGLLVVASTALLFAAFLVVRRWCPQSSIRLLGAEIVLLTAAVGAGTAMTRLIPPAGEQQESDRLTFLLGYGLPPRMGWAELAGWWRVDLLFAPLALVAAAGYLAGVWRQRRRDRAWPPARTVSWLAGCLTVLVATSSGIGAYAPGVLSVHLVGHALLFTVAPLLLVLGHPLSLVRRSVEPSTAERIDAVLSAGPVRTLNRPAVAWAVAAAALFGVYATGLFDAVVREHWSHPVMDALALGTGLLLFRSVLGSREPDHPVLIRLGLLFAVMMLHAGFAIWLLVQSEPVAEPFYTAVAMPFVTDLLAVQRSGAVLAWLLSDLTMAAAALAVVRTWLTTPPEESAVTRPPPTHVSGVRT